MTAGSFGQVGNHIFNQPPASREYNWQTQRQLICRDVLLRLPILFLFYYKFKHGIHFVSVTSGAPLSSMLGDEVGGMYLYSYTVGVTTTGMTEMRQETDNIHNAIIIQYRRVMASHPVHDRRP